MDNSDDLLWMDLRDKAGNHVGWLYIKASNPTGHFIDFEYELHDKENQTVKVETMTEMLPKSIADNIMRMTNYGSS